MCLCFFALAPAAPPPPPHGPQSAIRLFDIDLGVYGALQKLALSVVANDTGPGHLAAAVGARLISLLGPQSVAAWAAIGPNVHTVHEAAKWPTVNRIFALAMNLSSWQGTCESEWTQPEQLRDQRPEPVQEDWASQPSQYTGAFR
jgi:hypothetical protein